MFHAWSRTTIIHPVGIVWGQTPTSGAVSCLRGYLYTIVGVLSFQLSRINTVRSMHARDHSRWSIYVVVACRESGVIESSPNYAKRCANWRHAAPRRWPEDPKDERPPGIGLSVGLQINRYFLPPCVVFGGTDPFGTSLCITWHIQFNLIIFSHCCIQFFFGLWRPHVFVGLSTRTQSPADVASPPTTCLR